MPSADPLPLAQEIALNYAPRGAKPSWAAFFRLDVKLAAIVAQAREPLLAQIKLAWWRDNLAKSIPERPRGNELLDQIGSALSGAEHSLVTAIDAWERLLTAESEARAALSDFVDLRSGAYAALADHLAAASADHAQPWARAWVLGDCVGHLRDPDDRAWVAGQVDRLPRKWQTLAPAGRPLAILGRLGARAVQHGEPVFEGRLSALVAMRVGMFGR